MRAGQPAQRRLAQLLAVAGIDAAGLAVQQPQDAAGLREGLRFAMGGVAQHQLTGKVLGDQDPGRLIGVQQPRYMTFGHQWRQPGAMGGDLAGGVAVLRRTRP